MITTLTTAPLRATAAAMLLDMARLADSYLARALAEPGTDTCLKYSRMLDVLADQADNVIGLERACYDAGDLKASCAINADRLATTAAIFGHAHAARTASIPGWAWVNRTFTPAESVLLQ